MSKIDPRYDYTVTISGHIIIENKNNEILLTKRPETWQWAPGRWGLIGGKLYSQETFEECLKRKTLQEAGFEVKPKGLYQLKQLIMDGKHAYMYFFVADYNNEQITGDMPEYKWASLSYIEGMELTKYTEFFYKSMLTNYLKGDKKIFPINTIASLNYIEMQNDPEYQKWHENIINESFDPDKVDDYKKWKQKHT